MYDHYIEQSTDQPGKVANPARGQLNREKMIFLCPRSCLRIWSRETGSAVPSRASLLILHTQTKYDAYPRDPPEFRGGVHLFIYTAIRHRVSLPSLSGPASAYRWRSLPRVRPHRASSPQGSSTNGCCLFAGHHGPNNVHLSFPTSTIGMKWAC